MNAYRTLLRSVGVDKPHALLLVALAVAPMTVPAATAQSVAPQATTPSETKAAKVDDPTICRSEGRSGTHLSKKRCLLKSQWAEISRKDYFNGQERRFQESFTTNPQAKPF